MARKAPGCAHCLGEAGRMVERTPCADLFEQGLPDIRTRIPVPGAGLGEIGHAARVGSGHLATGGES